MSSSGTLRSTNRRPGNCMARSTRGLISDSPFCGRLRDRASTRKNMDDLVHVAIGGSGRVLRTAAVLARADVGRVPIRPVMGGVGLLVVAVVLSRLAKQLCEGWDVDPSRSGRRPFAAGAPRFDLLQQPAVAVGIFERGKRTVGLTFRVAPADA